MGKTAIIYWSGTGNTEAMAAAVYEGVKNTQADVSMFNVSEISADEAASYDTLILGCPAMGAEVLEESEFEPFFAELESKISGKNVALFGSYGWGDGEWMRNWEDTCKDDGAVMACDFVICNEEPDDVTIKSCKELGAALV